MYAVLVNQSIRLSRQRNQESGIFSIDGNTFWVCPKCNDFNEFFNFEKVYMPTITKLDE